jgi:hypothetical protein
MAYVDYFVDGGGAAPHYLNFASAIADLPADLNIGGIEPATTHRMLGAAGSWGTGTIGALANADATHNVEVTADSGVTRAQCIFALTNCSVNYAVIHDVTFNGSGTHSLQINGTNNLVYNCTFNGGGNYAFANGGNANNVVICCDGYGSAQTQFFGNNSKFYGCTAKGGARGFQYAEAHNCVSADASTACFANITAGGDYNCSTDATAPGVGSITNALVNDMRFADYGDNDFAIGALSILSGSGGNQAGTYVQDINNNPIALGSYPIGSHTYVAPAPRTSMMILVDKVF